MASVTIILSIIFIVITLTEYTAGVRSYAKFFTYIISFHLQDNSTKLLLLFPFYRCRHWSLITSPTQDDTVLKSRLGPKAEWRSCSISTNHEATQRLKVQAGHREPQITLALFLLCPFSYFTSTKPLVLAYLSPFSFERELQTVFRGAADNNSIGNEELESISLHRGSKCLFKNIIHVVCACRN